MDRHRSLYLWRVPDNVHHSVRTDKASKSLSFPEECEQEKESRGEETWSGIEKNREIPEIKIERANREKGKGPSSPQISLLRQMRKAIQDSVQEERPPEALQTVAPESDFLEEGKFHY